MLKQDLSLVPMRRDLHQAKLVFWLFIASLAVFFIASLATYIMIRTKAFRPITPSGYSEASIVLEDAAMGSAVPGSIDYVPLQIPLTFWISTALMLVTSVFLQRASWLVHRERQSEFRRWLYLALIPAVLFVLIQALGMNTLLGEHFLRTDGSTKVYGMSFTLALLHALHVIGGMVFLGFVIYQANRGKYDHERHWAVDHCAGYWHFLDVVWVSMLVMFLVTR